MENIPVIHASVNSFSLQDLTEKIVISKLMYNIPGVIPLYYLHLGNGMYIPCYDEDGLFVPECPFNVPQAVAFPPKEKGKKERTPREIKYKDFNEYMNEFQFPDEAILKLKNFVFRNRIFLKLQRYPAKTLVIPGRIKGDPVYNHNMYMRVLEKGQELQKNSAQTLFITLTHDVHGLGMDRRQAFKYHTKERSKFCKKLKRKYDCEIMYFTEVTNNGWPHTHYVVGLKEPLFKPVSDKKKARIITKGKFFETVKKSTASKVYEIKLAYDGNVGNYLAKYIAKSCFDKEGIKHTKNGRLYKESRKLIMTNLFPSLFGYQAFGMSWKKKEKKQSTQRERTWEEVQRKVSQITGEQTEEENQVIKLTEAARRAANLISFSIKENIINSCQVEMFTAKNGYQVDKSLIGMKNTCHPEIEKDMGLSNCTSGCRGCFFKMFYDQNREKIETSENPFPFRGFYFRDEAFDLYPAQLDFIERCERDRYHETHAKERYKENCRIQRRLWVTRRQEWTKNDVPTDFIPRPDIKLEYEMTKKGLPKPSYKGIKDYYRGNSRGELIREWKGQIQKLEEQVIGVSEKFSLEDIVSEIVDNPMEVDAVPVSQQITDDLLTSLKELCYNTVEDAKNPFTVFRRQVRSEEDRENFYIDEDDTIWAK